MAQLIPVRFSNRILLVAFVYLCVALVSSVVLFHHAKTTSFDGDESGWILSGYHYSNLLLHRDFDYDKWECPACLSFGSLTTHLGQFLIGVPVIFHTHGSGPRFKDYYDWSKSYDQNVAESRVPPRDVLMAGRYVSTVFGVALCVMILAIGHLSFHLLVGLTGSALLLCNTLYQESVTRAMTDSAFNVFLLTVCMIGVFYLGKNTTNNRNRLLAFTSGLFCGMAYSIKIHGAMIGSLLLFIVIFFKAYCRLSSLKNSIYDSSAYLCGLILVVYLFNPLSWPDPRSPATINRLSTPLSLFSKWRAFVKEDAESPVEIAAWKGSRLRTIHSLLVVRYRTFPGDWILFLLGICVLGYRIFRAIVERSPDAGIIPLAFFLINYIFIVSFLTLNWDRYYLTLVIAQQLITAFGLCFLAGKLLNKIRTLSRR